MHKVHRLQKIDIMDSKTVSEDVIGDIGFDQFFGPIDKAFDNKFPTDQKERHEFDKLMPYFSLEGDLLHDNGKWCVPAVQSPNFWKKLTKALWADTSGLPRHGPVLLETLMQRCSELLCRGFHLPAAEPFRWIPYKWNDTIWATNKVLERSLNRYNRRASHYCHRPWRDYNMGR